MAGIQGIDEFEEFGDDMDNIVDELPQTKKDALEATANEFKDILKQKIKSKQTAEGGTLNSRTSPYSPGGTNESSDDGFHMENKNAWQTEVVADDFAVVFPHPEVFKRASWMEYGTSDHGPVGDTPMYFNVGGTTIVLADRPPEESAFSDVYKQRSALDNTVEALLAHGEPTEVSGVNPQHFFREAVEQARSEGIFHDNMEREIEKLFEKHGVPLEG